MSAQTIAAVLKEQAALGDRTFIVIDDDRLTYAGAESRMGS